MASNEQLEKVLRELIKENRTALECISETLSQTAESKQYNRYEFAKGSQKVRAVCYRLDALEQSLKSKKYLSDFNKAG